MILLVEIHQFSVKLNIPKALDTGEVHSSYIETIIKYTPLTSSSQFMAGIIGNDKKL